MFGASFCVSCPSLTTPLALRTSVGVCIACLFSPSLSSSESSLFLVCCPPSVHLTTYSPDVSLVFAALLHDATCVHPLAAIVMRPALLVSLRIPYSLRLLRPAKRTCGSVLLLSSISTDNCSHAPSFTLAIVLPFVFLQAFESRAVCAPHLRQLVT